MPIEDVDYLKNNSNKQRYLFLVDSSDRDRTVFPTPSQYNVDFTMPFHNVVGFEVIDSSIPRTMYNVDIYNNTFVYSIYDANVTAASNLQPSDYTTTEVPPGDYTIETLIVAVNGVLKMPVNGNDISITMESVSNPPEIMSKVRFHCPYPFVFDMMHSTIAETLGFDLYVNLSESIQPIYQQRYIPINYPITTAVVQSPQSPQNTTATTAAIANNFQLYGSVHIPPNNPNVSYYIDNVFTGPRGVVRKQTITLPNKLAQSFQVKSRGYLRDVQAALTNTIGQISNLNIATWELWSSSNVIDTTTNTINSIPGTYMGTHNIIEAQYIDGGYSDSTMATSTWLTEGTYWLVFYSNDPTLLLYYNDYINTQNVATNSLLISGDTGNTWSSMDDTVNRIFYQASIIVNMQEDYNVITAPGIYNLVGEKYIVLRCPEIEQNSFRYLAYTKFFMGLAMFRLDTIGYNSGTNTAPQIVDINDSGSREFHPIGKLMRLSLRFETSKGNLYDFKGVNHTITFAVYYYQPIQKEKFQNSILNPNYNGDFIDYLYYQQEQEQDSDDQEYDYDRDNLENYKAMENRYNPEEIERIDEEIRYKSFRGNV